MMLARWISALRERLSALLARDAFEADLDEELRFHIDQATARNVRRGLSREEARREALAQLGSVESIKEAVRSETGVRPLQDTGRDIRYAFRQLLRTRALSSIVVVTIAVCLGANTAVFSVVHSVLLKPLPFPESDRLVRLFNSYPDSGNPRTGASVPEYLDRREHARSLESVALFREESNTLDVANGGRHAFALRVTPSFFTVLRVTPALGRAFSDLDGAPGTRRVIIGHALWQSAFGARPDAVGATVRLDGSAHEIIGVLPATFRFSTWDAQVFTPLVFSARDGIIEARHRDSFQMIGRLAPGATVEAAQAEVSSLNAARLADYPPELRRAVIDAGFSTVVRPYLTDLTRHVRQPLFLLWSGVMLVLIIGTANTATLLLLRTRTRSREMALRLALGAGPLRIVRQLVIESTALAAVGGVLGLLLARVSLRLLSAFEVYEIPRVDDVAIDWVVVAWMSGGLVSIGTVSGLMSAWTVLRRETGLDLRVLPAGAMRTSRAHRVLVSSQVALALVLIMTAGLLTASLRNLLAVDPGFDPRHVMVAALILPPSRYPTPHARVDFLERTIDAVQTVPGVRRMAAVSQLPFSGTGGRTRIVPDGVPTPQDQAVALPYYTAATPGSFEALGISITEGRTFRDSDRSGTPRVAIVDEILAKRYWPGTSAVGKRFWPGSNAGGGDDALTIVGVAEPIRHESLRESESAGAVYVPIAQASQGFVRIAVKYDGDRAAVWSAVRKKIAAVDPALVPFWTDTLEDSLGASLLMQRTPMQILTAFAIVALFLGVLGVYGVMAHEFGSRRREIAIRLAVGGSWSDIVTLMARDWTRIVGAGVVVGIAATLASSRLLASLLYGTAPHDPLVLGTALSALIIAALAACVVPIRRAIRVDPAMALREE